MFHPHWSIHRLVADVVLHSYLSLARALLTPSPSPTDPPPTKQPPTPSPSPTDQPSENMSWALSALALNPRPGPGPGPGPGHGLEWHSSRDPRSASRTPFPPFPPPALQLPPPLPPFPPSVLQLPPPLSSEAELRSHGVCSIPRSAYSGSGQRSDYGGVRVTGGSWRLYEDVRARDGVRTGS